MDRMIDVRKMPRTDLAQALEEYRSIIRAKGIAICVYERARCEEILREMAKRDLVRQ